MNYYYFHIVKELLLSLSFLSKFFESTLKTCFISILTIREIKCFSSSKNLRKEIMKMSSSLFTSDDNSSNIKVVAKVFRNLRNVKIKIGQPQYTSHNIRYKVSGSCTALHQNCSSCPTAFRATSCS